MKKLLLTFVLMFAALPSAHASFWDVIEAIAGASNSSSHSQPHRPPSYPYYNVSCTYTDNGWEEHFWGHESCGECLSKHGGCTETCSAEIQTCEAKGVDAAGILVTVSAEGEDRYEAERHAYDSCFYRGLRDCRVETCNSHSEQVSRRECRR